SEWNVLIGEGGRMACLSSGEKQEPEGLWKSGFCSTNGLNRLLLGQVSGNGIDADKGGAGHFGVLCGHSKVLFDADGEFQSINGIQRQSLGSKEQGVVVDAFGCHF